MGSSAPATVHATPAKILTPESAYLTAHKIPSAASCSGPPPRRCVSPSHSSPTASVCKARFSSTRALCGSRAQLAVNAVNDEGSFIFDSAAVRLSTGFQPHLAIAAWPTPCRYCAGSAQSRASTRPRSSASALQRTSKASDFQIWLRVMAHVAARAAETSMEHPGFFERAGPFALGAVAAAADAKLADGVGSRSRPEGCETPRRGGQRATSHFSTTRNISRPSRPRRASACLVAPKFANQAPAGTACLVTPEPYRGLRAGSSPVLPRCPQTEGRRRRRLAGAPDRQTRARRDR